MNSPLESTSNWYELPAVAEAAPLEFLRTGWGWLVETCEKYNSGYSSTVLRHYVGSCFSLDERPGRPEAPILLAFCTAIDTAAVTHPDEFLGIIKTSWASENAVVHRLIVRGLCLAVAHNPQIGLEYLCGDRRRFELGSRETYIQGDSIKLISKLASLLTKEELTRLEAVILSWTRYRDGVQLGKDQEEWDREGRLRLLDAIPSELLSPTTRDLVEREKQQLPHWNEKRISGRSGFVRQIPPISKEEMLTAGNEQILRAVTTVVRDRSQQKWIEDEGGWEEPGGPESAANEIASLAKDHPKRAIEIIEMLVANQKEEIAAHALNNLAQSDLTDEQIFNFIRKLASLKPNTEQLRSDASYLLYRRCKDDVGLPDDLCNVLIDWLAMSWDPEYGRIVASNTDSQDKQPDQPESVLWSHAGGMVESDRSFWSILAITHGYLARPSPAIDSWLEVIDKLLDRELALSTWAAYCWELRWIRITSCDKAKGAALVTKLFQRFPQLRERREGIRLIAEVSDLLPASFLQDFLDKLRQSTVFTQRQAYGELLALIAFRDKNQAWAIEKLNVEIEPVGTYNLDEAVATGLAFAAAQLWDVPERRADACQVLCKLIPHATNLTSQAIGSVFWAREDFVADNSTESLLRVLAQNPSSMSKIPIVDLVQHLAGLLPHKRQIVLAVCAGILKSGRREQELFEAGPNLVKIAMTLQRFSDTRSEGLSLLEELLRFGLDDAFRILQHIDLRPGTVAVREPRKRRRRQRR